MFIIPALAILLLAGSGTCLLASSLDLTDAQACHGTTAQVAIYLALDPGVQVNGLTFRLDVSPNAGAPALRRVPEFIRGAFSAPHGQQPALAGPRLTGKESDFCASHIRLRLVGGQEGGDETGASSWLLR